MKSISVAPSVLRAASVMASLSLQACGFAPYSLAAPDFTPCTRYALKIQTTECGGFLGCPEGKTKIPIDLGQSPAVAHMTVGMTGQLSVGAVGNDSPKGCWPTVPGSSGSGTAEWSSTDSSVVKFTPRLDQFGRPFPTVIFVNAMTPGTAVVYAQYLGERADFASCSDVNTLNNLDSCVPVGRIVVSP